MRASLAIAVMLAVAAPLAARAQAPPVPAPMPTGPYDMERALFGRLLTATDGGGIFPIQYLSLIAIFTQYNGFELPDDALRIARVMLNFQRAQLAADPTNLKIRSDVADAEYTVLVSQVRTGKGEGVADALGEQLARAGADARYQARLADFAELMAERGSYSVAESAARRSLELMKPSLTASGYVPDDPADDAQAQAHCAAVSQRSSELALRVASSSDEADSVALKALQPETEACLTRALAVVQRSQLRSQHETALYAMASAELAMGRWDAAEAPLRALTTAPKDYGSGRIDAYLWLGQLMKARGDPRWRAPALTARKLAKIDVGIRDELAPYENQFNPIQYVVGDKNAAGIAARSLLKVGETELLLDRPAAALTYIRGALPALQGPLSHTDLAIAREQYLEGLALLAEGDPAGALISLRRASDAYQAYAPSSRDARQAAISLFSGERDVHLAYLDAAIAARDNDAAGRSLFRSGRSRVSRSTNAMLERWASGPAQSEVRLAQNRAREATEADTVVQRAIAAGAPTTEVERAAEDARRRHEAAAAALAAASTKVPALQLFGYGVERRMDDVQTRLGPHDALLILSVGRDRGFAAVIRSKGAPTIARLGATRTRLQALVTEVRGTLQFVRNGQTTAPPPFAQGASRRLYDLLISPVEAGLAGADRIFISVGPPLDAAPFAALWDGHGWLGSRAALSLVTDPALLARDPPVRPAPSRTVLAVGDPVVSGSSFLRDLTVEDSRPARVAALPGAEAELQGVIEGYGDRRATPLIGPAATEAAFRREAVKGYRVIALATHAVTHSPAYREPRPAIVLTPVAGGGPDNDGLLHAPEIEALELEADLVVLSACETAAGDGNPGAETLTGLAQAFLYAGAHTVVATQWRVESTSAAALMRAMAARARTEPDAARRLKAAMDAVRAAPGTSHPAYWAPFVVVDGFGPAPRQPDAPRSPPSDGVT